MSEGFVKSLIITKAIADSKLVYCDIVSLHHFIYLHMKYAIFNIPGIGIVVTKPICCG